MASVTDIFADLTWRGLVYQQTSEEIGKWLLEKPRTVYAGFDPTADSLHVGSLLPLMMLRRFQKAGHQPIALVGGATGCIGDPSGKSAERSLQTLDQIEDNIKGIRGQMEQLLDFQGDNAAVIANNYDWISKFSFIDFLRDVGKHFPVGVMMSKDSVKSRLENPDVGISYTEFSYMLLQGYDFVHLNKAHNCQLQIGGSDQWGNVTAGIDLGRRMGREGLMGMTCPLLTKADGTKMGKTESGAIWLDPNRTSPYQFYQYWINTDDADVSKCLRFLTELPKEEVEDLDKQREEHPNANASQKKLAEEVTRLIHGQEGLDKALRATNVFFGGSLEGLDASDLNAIFEDVPSSEIDKTTIEQGLPIIDALVQSKLVKSKGEARKLVAQGGANVNNIRIENDTDKVDSSQIVGDNMILIRAGKKRYALLKLV